MYPVKLPKTSLSDKNDTWNLYYEVNCEGVEETVCTVYTHNKHIVYLPCFFLVSWPPVGTMKDSTFLPGTNWMSKCREG